MTPTIAVIIWAVALISIPVLLVLCIWQNRQLNKKIEDMKRANGVRFGPRRSRR